MVAIEQAVAGPFATRQLAGDGQRVMQGRCLHMPGNGGLAGDALDGPANPERTAAVSNGFVTARTNTGHDARKEPSGSFILSNPQKAIDYAYRAVHVTAETAKRAAYCAAGTTSGTE